MAKHVDNKANVNAATPTEEVQPLDTDLPVDADAEANTGVVNGLDKKKIAGLGIVVGLVIVAAIVVFSLSKKPTATSTPAPVVVQTPPGVPPKPGKMPAATNPAAQQKPAATVNPSQPVVSTLPRPGDANWVKGVKKPLPVPNGLEATPGQPGSNTPQVSVVPQTVSGTSAPANSKDAAMKKLWDSGAAAKHRGDYATARKDWQRILELDPGHAGIQAAINKLPK